MSLTIKKIDGLYYQINGDKKAKLAMEDGKPILVDGKPITATKYAGLKRGMDRIKKRVDAGLKTKKEMKNIPAELSERDQIMFVMKSYSNIGRIINPCLAAQILAVSLDARALSFMTNDIDPLVQTIMVRKNPDYAAKIITHQGSVSYEAQMAAVSRDVSAILNINDPSGKVIEAAVTKFKRDTDKLYKVIMSDDMKKALKNRSVKRLFKAFDILEDRLEKDTITKFNTIVYKLGLDEVFDEEDEED